MGGRGVGSRGTLGARRAWRARAQLAGANLGRCAGSVTPGIQRFGPAAHSASRRAPYASPAYMQRTLAAAAAAGKCALPRLSADGDDDV